MTLRDRVALLVTRRRIRQLLRRQAERGVFPVEIRSNVGLGARLAWCLEIMAYCNEHGLEPQVKFSYPTSAAGEDYFSPFFRINGAQRPAASEFATISSIIELDLGADYDRVLTLDLAQFLIEKYLRVRDEIVSEADEFCRRNFDGKSVLGVHYRGTDKAVESPPVPFGAVRANIDEYLKLYPETDLIFVATDDESFLDAMRAEALGRPIVFREDAIRSMDGASVHKSPDTDKYDVNKDAVVNCLILSRCNGLLKTSSILSDWAKLFNPRLPLVILNRPYDEHIWFPERELVKQNLFDPV
jgi:hypothetical protein